MQPFHETMRLQEDEILRLKAREADLLATCGRYLERARKAEELLRKAYNKLDELEMRVRAAMSNVEVHDHDLGPQVTR